MDQPISPRPGAAPDPVALSPAQRKAFDEALAAPRPVTLQGRSGSGKSAVLAALHSQVGGERLDARDLLRAIEGRHPLGGEHGVLELLDAALARSETVLVDDFHLVGNFLCCGHFYPRQGLLEAVLAAAFARAERDERRLVLAVEGMGSRALWELAAVA